MKSSLIPPFAESGIQEARLCFTLQHWCLWQSEEPSPGVRWPGGEVLPYNGDSAEVGFLPMMQSRRLSPLARAAIAVASHCRQKSGDMPSVFFSNHGEGQYYFEMLQEIAGSEDVSPSRFSLCVHNAIAGLSSFHSSSFQPYVSLAGGTEGMFAAFLEAGGMLMETPKVLVVWYEQPLPDAYRAYLATSETTWALAMVLTKAGEPGLQLQLTRRPNNDQPVTENNALSLIQSILENRLNSICCLDRSIWQWSLNGSVAKFS
jgi:hypothetical protein